jgi:uncharacterized protein
VDHVHIISEELGLKLDQVHSTVDLLDQGATVPFIARYRKEITGSLDEVSITKIRDRRQQLVDLDARKTSVLKSLDDNGHLTNELKTKVIGVKTLAELEDLYLPYRPKRRTKATIAREKGLEPLALELLKQENRHPDELAVSYLNTELGVASIADALAGARHIISEIINEDSAIRQQMRELFLKKGIIHCQVATNRESEAAKYRDYFDWKEPAATVPSHRMLAMRRGEKEDLLNLKMGPPENMALEHIEKFYLRGTGLDTTQVKMAVQDCYRRLLSRSMETELRLATKQKADEQAIRVFTRNLRQLLLSPPLGSKRIMGIDPGYRTGCKVVCLDRQGKLLAYDTVYPHLSNRKDQQAADKISDLCEKFKIEAIAVGNGTAGRETESFVRRIDSLKKIAVLMVNESGASIYSASETARREFPNLDLTVRGAVSIGRRLMDPLSELVKIEPKSIGIGQYQHDVDQVALKTALDDVVTSCVNAVGVDVNRASVELLTYVSGLGPQLAANIVAHRNANGPFDTKATLMNVPRLGPKAFEQSAGFLRILEGSDPLDASAVHPESYPVVDTMAQDLGCTVIDLMQHPNMRNKIDLSRYVSERIGLPTLQDILSELAKPGRDPRKDFSSIEFDRHVNNIKDLKPGMSLQGVVTNVTAFGAFVDIGVHQDGLVHISEMADNFVRDPSDVVALNQRVKVKVLAVDLERNRISLSMKTIPGVRSTSSKKKSLHRQNPPEIKKKIHKRKPRPFNNPFAQALSRTPKQK